MSKEYNKLEKSISDFDNNVKKSGDLLKILEQLRNDIEHKIQTIIDIQNTLDEKLNTHNENSKVFIDKSQYYIGFLEDNMEKMDNKIKEISGFLNEKISDAENALSRSLKRYDDDITRSIDDFKEQSKKQSDLIIESSNKSLNELNQELTQSISKFKKDLFDYSNSHQKEMKKHTDKIISNMQSKMSSQISEMVQINKKVHNYYENYNKRLLISLLIFGLPIALMQIVILVLLIGSN